MDLNIIAEYNAFDRTASSPASLSSPVTSTSSCCKTRKSVFLPKNSFPNSFLIHVSKATPDGLLLDVRPLLCLPSSSPPSSSCFRDESHLRQHRPQPEHYQDVPPAVLLARNEAEKKKLSNHNTNGTSFKRNPADEEMEGLRDCISMAHESLTCGPGLPSVMQSLASSSSSKEQEDGSGRLVVFTPENNCHPPSSLTSNLTENLTEEVKRRKGILKRREEKENMGCSQTYSDRKEYSVSLDDDAAEKTASSAACCLFFSSKVTSSPGSDDLKNQVQDNNKCLNSPQTTTSYSSLEASGGGCHENSNNKNKKDNDDNYLKTNDVKNKKMVILEEDVVHEPALHADSLLPSLSFPSSSTSFSYISSTNSNNNDLHRELKRRRRMIEEAEQHELRQKEQRMQHQRRQEESTMNHGGDHHPALTPTSHDTSSQPSSWIPRGFPGISFLAGSSSLPWEKEKNSAGNALRPVIGNSIGLQMIFSALIILYIAIRILMS